MNKFEIEVIELELLADSILKRYGYDFRNYAKASFSRRIKLFLETTGCKNISELIPHILNDEEIFNNLLMRLSITVTEMFRDPSVYSVIRKEVFELLRTYPFLKIWHAGCATGEEVYSMAILLKEEGLYDRCQIYATDFNSMALKAASDGIFPIKSIKQFTANYQKAGGVNTFSDYFVTDKESAIILNELKKNITFANHNLVTDTVFGEMNLIFCRNVLIYFDQKLQDKVLNLFSDSLVRNGFLCLGSKETLRFSKVEQDFEPLFEKHKIFKKIKV